MIVSRRTFGWSLAAIFATMARPAAARDAGDWPNVFIAPMGQPFRAKIGAPYPVVDWFKQADKDGDGKLDHAEFMADADAFFDVLDINHDGALSSYEVALYEHKTAPEILGFNISVGDLRGTRAIPGGQLWLAQYNNPYAPNNGQPTGSQGGVLTQETPNNPTASTEVLPEGAAPFSLLEVPEPLAAADVDFDGVITKANFLKVADRRFTKLDHNDDGFLVLAKLPKTYVQKRLENQSRKGFHF
jgi:hypothetical protein